MRGVCLLLLLALAGGVRAAGQSVVPRVVETVVVTSGTLPVTFRELPRTVRVVTRDEIERLPARTVTDLIRLVSSVDVRARGPRGVQADFSVRGAGFGQVLMLVDGVRVNNAQTGHHNSDLPVSLDEIERVEVLLGPGSSSFGADAFGGTINLITRRGDSSPRVSAAIGEHELVDVSGAASARVGGVVQRVAGQMARSSGFMFDRDFRSVTLSSRTALGARTAITAAFADKAFGANGFYGASPSREWTSLWMVGVDRTILDRDGRHVSARTSYRNHSDRFLWDVNRPGFFENTHRTHSLEAGVRLRWRAGSRTEIGAVAETAGDWITSSNLGDHSLARAGVAVDVQHRLGESTTVQAALRGDVYSTFGGAASPSIGLSRWLSPRFRVRSSLGRAFRVPTFTERYYRDPGHLAQETLEPERAWAFDAATDWLPSAEWQATAGVFRRWDQGVIDWVKAMPAEVWRTTNIRSVVTTGAEAGLKRTMARGASVGLDYTWQSVDAGELGVLSKYTLDYARHSLVLTASLMLPGSVDVGARFEGRDRVDRVPYVLTALRLSRRAAGLRFSAEVSNLFDVQYEEVRGVAMPGRWVMLGIEVAR